MIQIDQLRPVELCSPIAASKRGFFSRFARSTRSTQEQRRVHHMVRGETPLRLLHCGTKVLLECGKERWDVRDLQPEYFKSAAKGANAAIFA
eukprot:17994-Heterococcus_DN1.PRE.1